MTMPASRGKVVARHDPGFFVRSESDAVAAVTGIFAVGIRGCTRVSARLIHPAHPMTRTSTRSRTPERACTPGTPAARSLARGRTAVRVRLSAPQETYWLARRPAADESAFDHVARPTEQAAANRRPRSRAQPLRRLPAPPARARGSVR